MLSTIEPDFVSQLAAQRWLLPVLAQFHQRGGARFAELRGAIGLPRDSLARTLDSAKEMGWIAPNPGHGHPLRPEYVLTETGRAAATIAAGLYARLQALGLAAPDLTRWSLPVLRALAGGNERFNQLERALHPATPRALSQTLHVLVANDLVGREIAGDFPPSSRYRLTERGRKLVV
jgi:DNA-binding HxlR family transcriptional regulator